MPGYKMKDKKKKVMSYKSGGKIKKDKKMSYKKGGLVKKAK